jgi:hypothetical protein
LVEVKAKVSDGVKAKGRSWKVQAKGLAGVRWKGSAREAVGLESCVEIGELVGLPHGGWFYDKFNQYEQYDTGSQGDYLLLN